MIDTNSEAFARVGLSVVGLSGFMAVARALANWHCVSVSRLSLVCLIVGLGLGEPTVEHLKTGNERSA